MVYCIWERLLRASYLIIDTWATLGGIQNSKKIYKFQLVSNKFKYIREPDSLIFFNLLMDREKLLGRQ